MQQQYQIVKTETTRELEKAVNAWLLHGWQPQGGISFTLGGRPVQAITRRPSVKRTHLSV